MTLPLLGTKWVEACVQQQIRNECNNNKKDMAVGTEYEIYFALTANVNTQTDDNIIVRSQNGIRVKDAKVLYGNATRYQRADKNTNSHSTFKKY